ncbi:MAG TPA: alpha-1,4-glucan--maltose-1-phosphate maltosyltransferase [Acidimicrobiales bacterium]
MTRLAPAPSRIVIADVVPQVAAGRFPVKRVVGEPVDVGATVLVDGHDHLAVVVAHKAPGARGWTEEAMVSDNPGLDRWQGRFVPEAVGLHRFRVRAWIDPVATWRDGTRRKLDAGMDLTSDLLAGAALLETSAAAASGRVAARLRVAAEALRTGDDAVIADDHQGAELEALARRSLRAADASVSEPVTVDVEPERALFSTWYELFPRSVGTLADVADLLEELADLGIDVLYLPPVHPIGRTHRKGRGNATEAGPTDPGSPWAIGGAEGGHTAVHPELGTVDDVEALARAAGELDIALALDLAFQCSPDHPWVTAHPEWFRHRPDGTIQYAENPPKAYQDIYPLDFESPAWQALWDELLAVTLFWCDHGVRVFRVDNPHTKPFAFWEWLIAEVRRRHPDTIFLAEAFTRPEIMRRLGQVGFTQGYTYFTWRTSGAELAEYFSELASAPWVDEFRPNAWPTTPDILPWHLQHAPLEAFAVRLALAATLSPSYGVYGPGFELGDNEPAGNDKEEFADSEKYEARRWDLTSERSLRPLMGQLNAIRHQHLALHTLRTLRFHGSDNDALLCFSKTAHAGASVDPARPGSATVLVVVNLDPLGVQRGTISFDPAALGLDPARPFEVDDVLGGHRFAWQGEHAFIELDPKSHPAHVFRVTQLDAGPPEDT